jgi:hypothetical protein
MRTGKYCDRRDIFGFEIHSLAAIREMLIPRDIKMLAFMAIYHCYSLFIQTIRTLFLCDGKVYSETAYPICLRVKIIITIADKIK